MTEYYSNDENLRYKIYSPVDEVGGLIDGAKEEITIQFSSNDNESLEIPSIIINFNSRHIIADKRDIVTQEGTLWSSTTVTTLKEKLTAAGTLAIALTAGAVTNMGITTTSRFGFDNTANFVIANDDGTTVLLDNLQSVRPVTSIARSAFFQRSNLKDIIIGNNVRAIGVTSFFGCTNLTSITIKGSVTNIDSSAFNGCTGLTDIKIPSGDCERLQEALANQWKIPDITICLSVMQSIQKKL